MMRFSRPVRSLYIGFLWAYVAALHPGVSFAKAAAPARSRRSARVIRRFRPEHHRSVRNRKYVTVTWYDPGTTKEWHYPENVTFAFYQADHPWGPWSYIGEKSCNDFLGDTKQRISRWYGPSLSPRFITANRDGSVTAILTFSGQLWDDKPDSLYKNNSCPVTFHTTPQLKVVKTFNDTDATYSGGWFHQPHRGYGDYQDDVHVTTKTGDYVDFTFTGRGIEVLSEKYKDMGNVEVLIDGVSQGTFSLYQDPMPRLYQVEIYRNMNLSAGAHALRVVNKGPEGKFCLIDGFRVYDIVVVQASEARATPAEVIARLVGASAATFTNQETKRRTKWIR